MTTNINLPKSGMGIEEATIVRWLKTVGDAVQKGEIVAEAETAKAVQEIEAPSSGRLTKILVEVEQTVPVNTVIGIIAEEGE
jgi:pyruvate/2-oxoglutarate dehydrogenase complex dihydrolipoamide acyltransferase (E2) component